MAQPKPSPTESPEQEFYRRWKTQPENRGRLAMAAALPVVAPFAAMAPMATLKAASTVGAAGAAYDSVDTARALRNVQSGQATKTQYDLAADYFRQNIGSASTKEQESRVLDTAISSWYEPMLSRAGKLGGTVGNVADVVQAAAGFVSSQYAREIAGLPYAQTPGSSTSRAWTAVKNITSLVAGMYSRKIEAVPGADEAIAYFGGVSANLISKHELTDEKTAIAALEAMRKRYPQYEPHKK